MKANATRILSIKTHNNSKQSALNRKTHHIDKPKRLVKRISADDEEFCTPEPLPEMTAELATQGLNEELRLIFGSFESFHKWYKNADEIAKTKTLGEGYTNIDFVCNYNKKVNPIVIFLSDGSGLLFDDYSMFVYFISKGKCELI